MKYFYLVILFIFFNCSEPNSYTENSQQNSQTTIISKCGNPKIDFDEQCDGSLLNNETCISLDFKGGVLACSADCTFDTSSCKNKEESELSRVLSAYVAPEDVQFYDYVIQLCATHSEELWHGFDCKKEPFSIRVKDHDLLFNMENATASRYNKKVTYTKLENIYNNKPIFESNQSVIPIAIPNSYTVNDIAVAQIVTPHQMEEFMSSVSDEIRNQSRDLDMDTDNMLPYLLGMSVHELFHGYQFNNIYPGGIPQRPSIAGHRNAIDSGRLSEALIAEETTVLSDVLKSKDVCKIKNYRMKFAQHREKLKPEEIRSETFWEWQEGTAYYVEQTISNLFLDKTLAIPPWVKDTDHFLKQIRRASDAATKMIHEPGYIKKYGWLYENGLLKTRILAKHLPTWKSHVSKVGNSLETAIDVLIATKCSK